MFEISEEAYADCAADVSALAVEHHACVARPGDFEVDPDLGIYRQLGDVGALFVGTVREAKCLVGYALFIIVPHLHHRGLQWACGDGLWLVPAARRPRVADRLLAFCEDGLKKRGVLLVNMAAHPDHPALGRLLERRRYKLTSMGFSRRL